MDFVCLMSAIINYEHILWSACDKRSIITSTGAGGHSRCTKAFLFSMVDPYGHEPTKIPLTLQGQRNSISCRADLGPTFVGESHGLRISDHANLSYSESNGIYSACNFPPGRETANFQFVVTDYEVFSLN